MAKITISMDDGEVFAVLSDYFSDANKAPGADGEIGHLEKKLNRDRLISEIAYFVRQARQRDRRNPLTGEE